MMQQIQHQGLKIVTFSLVNLMAFGSSLEETCACWMDQRVSTAPVEIKRRCHGYGKA